MNAIPNLHRSLVLLAGMAALASGGRAVADPPSRVARLAFTSGAVSLSPAGDEEWVVASINRPLTTGDRLWVDARSRAEVQAGGAAVRMDGGTSVVLLNLDDRIAQLQLPQGVLGIRVRFLGAGQVLEIDTPNLAFTIRRAGEYRIEVDPERDTTSIVVRAGRGEAYGEGAGYVVDSRQAFRFHGTGLREYELVDGSGRDDFDRWTLERERRFASSTSARYVSRDVVGYEDLDAYGTWRFEADYGNVWVPTRVASGWSPYHDGHWAWVDPWGWTWVDDAPWGFAVSHYGRWANARGTWIWVPGPVRSQAVYAPALVAFVGGINFQVSISGGSVGAVAWFPLGPREVYRPAYPVSRTYFQDVNRSNTVINQTTITNVYNDTHVTNVYVNQRVQGAVVAVPATAFVQSQSVSRAAVPVRREAIDAAPVSTVASVAPVARSVHGSGQAGTRPPAKPLERPVVARTAPPPAPIGFAAQEPQLAARPGRPLDDATRKALKPTRSIATPRVEVVAAPSPTAPPPPVARTPAGERASAGPATATPMSQPERRGASDSQAKQERKDEAKAAAPAQPARRATPPPVDPPPPAAAAPAPPARAQSAPPPDPRGAPDSQARQERKDEARAATPAQPATPGPPPEGSRKKGSGGQSETDDEPGSDGKQRSEGSGKRHSP